MEDAVEPWIKKMSNAIGDFSIGWREKVADPRLTKGRRSDAHPGLLVALFVACRIYHLAQMRPEIATA